MKRQRYTLYSLNSFSFSPSQSLCGRIMMTKKKKIVVFSIFTLSFAAAAAILDIFSQSFFWKKKIQQQQEKPNRGGGGGGPDDRISELPVEILHHILGFLEMDELLIGTSLVSTKWRNLWKSVSTLNFPICMISRRRTDDDSVVVDDDDDSVVVVDNGGGGGGIRNNVEKYQNFVDHVLRLRDSQASKIQIFRYYCWDYYSNSREGGRGGGYDYLERFHNFIVSAVVNQGAQGIEIIGSHLDLDESSGNNNNRIIHFNPSIFTSGGLLRKFTFFVLNSHIQIQFPRSMCCAATQLTHLSLSQIILPEGDEDAQLHLVCPVLETFRMTTCHSEHLKVLDISAPRLNTLYIDNRGFGSFVDFLGGCRIEIHTPNLTSLNYSGRVYVDCFTENLPRIADATLLISEEPGMVVEQTTSFAIKLLKGLTSAESFTLGGFEFFSQDTLKHLLTSFTSLRTLELVTNCNITSIHGMVHFLNSCSSVEKLLLVLKVDKKFVEVEGDEHLMLPQCRLSHLKHVHIKRLCGHENEIEFVKFLLKSSVVLEEIIIHTTSDSSKQSIEEKLKQFIEEEPSFRSIKLCVLKVERNVFYDI